MMSREVFQKYYAKLVKTLPMNDDAFVSELYSFGLLSDDLKVQLQLVQRTSADKAVRFLESVKPSVTSGIGSAFNNLLIAMEDCGDESVKELAKLIRTKLRTPHGENF